MNGSGPAVRRLCAVVDVEGYSRHLNPVQIGIQQRLDAVLRSGLHAAGVLRRRTEHQDRGDGRLLVLPAGVDEARVVPGLLRGVLNALAADRARAADRAEPALRLRLALNQGVVHLAATGYVGRAIVDVCRLVDSAEVRAELSAVPDADLALIAADDLYRDVLAHGYGGFPHDGFRLVRIRGPKGFQATARLRALSAAALGPDTAAVTAAAAAAAVLPLAALTPLMGAARAAQLAADDDASDWAEPVDDDLDDTDLTDDPIEDNEDSDDLLS